MCPRTDEQFAAIRRRSRQAILDASLRLFASKGYSETTVADIARNAGISKGLIYNYFPGKGHILGSLIDQFVVKFLPPQAARGKVPDPPAYLSEVIHQWFAMIRSEPSLIRLGAQFHTDPALQKVIRNKLLEYDRTFMPLFNDIFRRLGSLDPEVETLVLGSIMDGIALNYAATPEAYPLGRIERHLVKQYTSTKRRQK